MTLARRHLGLGCEAPTWAAQANRQGTYTPFEPAHIEFA